MSSLINLPPGALETTNTKLAAALCAVGIPLRTDVPLRIISGGRNDQVCFFFQEKSPCGDYHTAELIRAWDNESWHLLNPEHPFAYLKVAFENQERLRDMIRSGKPIGCVQRGSKIGFLSIHAGDHAQHTFFKEFNRK